MLQIISSFKKIIFTLSITFCSLLANASDTTGLQDVDSMLKTGQNIVAVSAKWGGIITVVVAALALGSGRLQGSVAQAVSKVFIVIGLLMAAFSYFGNEVRWGFSF
jgi:hypothetical protein